MRATMKRIGAAILVLGLVALAVRAQIVSPHRPSHAAEKNEAVEYLYPEQLSVPVGKATPVELHFRVAEGLHINSHNPSNEYLIPTTFSIPDGAGVRLDAASYPAGKTMALPADPKTILNVYTGEFTIRARIVATSGNHLVEAKLRYQACDETQCMPPKTIPVTIDVIGK